MLVVVGVVNTLRLGSSLRVEKVQPWEVPWLLKKKKKVLGLSTTCLLTGIDKDPPKNMINMIIFFISFEGLSRGMVL